MLTTSRNHVSISKKNANFILSAKKVTTCSDRSIRWRKGRTHADDWSFYASGPTSLLCRDSMLDSLRFVRWDRPLGTHSQGESLIVAPDAPPRSRPALRTAPHPRHRRGPRRPHAPDDARAPQVNIWLGNARLRLWRPALQALRDSGDADASSPAEEPPP